MTTMTTMEEAAQDHRTQKRRKEVQQIRTADGSIRVSTSRCSPIQSKRHVIPFEEPSVLKSEMLPNEGTTNRKDHTVLPKYSELYAGNADLWGWIRIENTPIDYPIMHTPQEPEYYLRRAFDRSDLTSGTPFLDGRCYEDCGNYIIYGHHMRNNSMFGTLPEYKSEEYRDAHRMILLDTLYESSEYEVIAAFYSRVYYQGEEGFFYNNYTDLTDKRSFDEFIEGVRNATLYISDFSVEFGDQLITLSTCSYHTSNGRFAVVAKKCK